MAKSINKKMPHHYFKNIILMKYRLQMVNEDDSFIHDSIFENLDVPVPLKLLLNQINNVKTLWDSISDENKSTIWLHIKVIIILNDKCEERNLNKQAYSAC
jgi:hypothetical protein